MSIPTGAAARLAAGASLPLRALSYLAARRELWSCALVPVLLTLAGLAVGVAAAVPLSGSVLELLWARPEGALAFAWWLARAAVYLVLVYVAAMALPAAVSAPFSDRLSARVEALELGTVGEGGFRRAAAEAWAGTAHAIGRVAWLVLGHALILPALLVPFAYPVLAFVWTARWTAVEYLGVPMARNVLRLADVRAALRAVRPLGAGFGGVLALLFMVPFANLLVLPVGTVAGTLLYCDLVRAGQIESPSPAAGRRNRLTA
jgi:CysZ protein